MKAFRFISLALVAVLMCVNFTSCSNEEIAPKEEDKYVTVDLGVTGEYLKVSESPLGTRTSTTTDTYGINVYTVKDDGEVEDYASGLFTSLNNLKIKLLDGKKYKFTVGIYVNDNVYYDDGAGSYVSSGIGPLGKICDNFFNGGTHTIPMMGNNEYDYYYGELAEYTPTENGTVEIETKRTVYGAHFIAEGLNEGTLKIHVTAVSGASYSVNLTDENPEYNGVYCFGSPWSAWKGVNGGNYYTTKYLRVYWTKDDGSETPLGTFDVTFKRNIKTTIVIKAADPSQQNGIVVTKEETRMADDENKYVIEGGTVTEVPVTSQQ